MSQSYWAWYAAGGHNQYGLGTSDTMAAVATKKMSQGGGASRAVGDNSDSLGYSEWSQYRTGGGSWSYAEVRCFECTVHTAVTAQQHFTCKLSLSALCELEYGASFISISG